MLHHLGHGRPSSLRATISGLFGRLARFFRSAQLFFSSIIQRKILSIKRSWLFSPSTQPDSRKVIADKTYLYPSRVFKPKMKDAGPLPLIIMAHGGAFIINNPSIDDPVARFLSDNCNCVVVNIDYRKAPLHPFPAAYEDVVESILYLIGEGGRDLPIDRDRVVLFGSSAGGGLFLSAAQDPRLRGKVLGIVAFCPLVNFEPTAEEQIAKRPDPSIPDLVGYGWNVMVDMYVGTTDATVLRDLRLSPTNFKNREDLPKNIYFLGCEHDMMCHETKVMAEKLMQAGEGQSAENVQCAIVEGQIHGFYRFPAKTPDQEEKRVRAEESAYQGIAQWLRDVFSKK